jgi:hypothetical protein
MAKELSKKEIVKAICTDYVNRRNAKYPKATPFELRPTICESMVDWFQGDLRDIVPYMLNASATMVHYNKEFLDKHNLYCDLHMVYSPHIMSLACKDMEVHEEPMFELFVSDHTYTGGKVTHYFLVAVGYNEHASLHVVEYGQITLEGEIIKTIQNEG